MNILADDVGKHVQKWLKSNVEVSDIRFCCSGNRITVILRSIYNLRKELRHQVVTQVVTQVDFQMRRQNAFHYLIDDYFGECAIL